MNSFIFSAARLRHYNDSIIRIVVVFQGQIHSFSHLQQNVKADCINQVIGSIAFPTLNKILSVLYKLGDWLRQGWLAGYIYSLLQPSTSARSDTPPVQVKVSHNILHYYRLAMKVEMATKNTLFVISSPQVQEYGCHHFDEFHPLLIVSLPSN